MGLLLQTCLGNHPFSDAAVPFGSAHAPFFLEAVGDIDGLSTKELAFHLGDGVVGTLKIIEADKPVLLGLACVRIPHDLGRDHNPKL
jgi:hypothetical protein